MALTAVEAEFHGPDWALGQSTMAELPDGSVVARMTSEGRDTLGAHRSFRSARPVPAADVPTLRGHFGALRP